MLQALLRGKLSREHEEIEDILTSNVFGLLQYCDPSLVVKFLSAVRWVGDDQSGSRLTTAANIILVDWQFWPFWSEPGCNPCEPDLVLTITIEGQPVALLLIEAKLNSAKSSTADDTPIPSDQLAKEWDNLAARATASGLLPILVYLTGHFSCPLSEITDAVDELWRKRKQRPTIGWLSWRDLPPILRRAPKTPLHDDLVSLLERMDLTYFGGLSPIDPTPINWAFGLGFTWNIATPDKMWRFE